MLERVEVDRTHSSGSMTITLLRRYTSLLERKLRRAGERPLPVSTAFFARYSCDILHKLIRQKELDELYVSNQAPETMRFGLLCYCDVRPYEISPASAKQHRL